jgi:hypothetical protein
MSVCACVHAYAGFYLQDNIIIMFIVDDMIVTVWTVKQKDASHTQLPSYFKAALSRFKMYFGYIGRYEYSHSSPHATLTNKNIRITDK